MDKIANKRRNLPFYQQCKKWINPMWIRRHFYANFTVLSTILLISWNNVLVLILTHLFKLVSNKFKLWPRRSPEEKIGLEFQRMNFKVRLALLKWGASSRWSSRPNFAWGSIDTMTIAKTHPNFIRVKLGLGQFQIRVRVNYKLGLGSVPN